MEQIFRRTCIYILIDVDDNIDYFHHIRANINININAHANINNDHTDIVSHTHTCLPGTRRKAGRRGRMVSPKIKEIFTVYLKIKVFEETFHITCRI